MVAPNMNVTGSTTNFSQFGISGTQFNRQGAVTLCLMCGVSGLSVMPLACDTRGILLTGSTI